MRGSCRALPIVPAKLSYSLSSNLLLQIYVTRHMGDYTQRVSAEHFGALKARCDAGELFALPEIGAFFDDKAHLEDIKQLCSFTHPILEVPGKPWPTFDSADKLKSHIERTHQQHFCDLCLSARKVFVSEQLLYSKQQLERHCRAGDLEGKLAWPDALLAQVNASQLLHIVTYNSFGDIMMSALWARSFDVSWRCMMQTPPRSFARPKQKVAVPTASSS